MNTDANVPLERADSVTVYLFPESRSARIVLYEFDAATATRLEIGAWDFQDFPSHDWEAVLNRVGPWLNRRNLAYAGEAAWDTQEATAPTATLYALDERPRR